jgi:hypothetical protein
VLGILTLDTAFPRIRGDVGCADTFDFPVRYATVPGAVPDAVVHRRDDAALPSFVVAAQELVDAGALGIATTCGFLARWQDALVAKLAVPVMTSVLLAAPLVARTLPAGRRLGIVTYSADDLDAPVLATAGVPPGTPVVGVDPGGVFARTIRHGAATLDRGAMAADVVGAARRLVERHPDVGAIVLECANMPPYADAVRDAVDLPVHDAADLVRWFHAGLARAPR